MPALATTEGKLPSASDQDRGRTFPCNQCGADLLFHIGAQRLRCQHCGAEKELSPGAGPVSEQDLQAALAKLRARRVETTPRAPAAHQIRCQSCGAKVIFAGTLTSTSCAYCGSPIQRETAHQAQPDRVPVDAVLPFAVDTATAKANLARWVRSRWFAPGEFKRRGAQGKFEGVYLPYFTFDAMTATSYQGLRGRRYTETVGSGKNKRTVTRTEWTRVSGEFQRFFDDLLVSASSCLPQPLLRGLEPWPLASCRPYTPEVLQGYLAHTYDLDLPEAFQVGRERIESAITDEVNERIGGDEQRIEEMHTQWSALSYKHFLLPVWLLAYRYRDKSYRVAINACSGEVRGERPWSALKIVLTILLILAIGGGIAGGVAQYRLYRERTSPPATVVPAPHRAPAPVIPTPAYVPPPVVQPPPRPSKKLKAKPGAKARERQRKRSPTR